MRLETSAFVLSTIGSGRASKSCRVKVYAVPVFWINALIFAVNLNGLLHSFLAIQFHCERDWLARSQHELIGRGIKSRCFRLERIIAGIQASEPELAIGVSCGLLCDLILRSFNTHSHTRKRLALRIADISFDYSLGRRACDANN